MSETTASGVGTGRPDDDPYIALEREIRLIFRRAQSAGARIAHHVHPELEASAYPLLAHIAQHPGTRGSDLAAHFGVGRATMSRQLSRLVDLRLVERDIDPEDSRGQRITLTEEGAERFEKARASRIEMFAGALGHWDQQDVRRLADLLHRYSDDVVAWHAEHG